ncbi:MAG: mutarotase [Flavobacteriaceae bacterium]|nr:mutarotase [Flavobacteriaceae bacterium]
MNLADHYDNLYQNSIDEIRTEGCKTDPLIKSPTDNRFGVTLLIRPPILVKKRIEIFLKELKNIDNQQYYYPLSDIHITVMSIISCANGFELKNISIPDYMRIIEKSIQDVGKFRIKFKGITASTSTIMIQGFYGEILNTFRNNLRINFQKSHLEQTIDKRYSIKTGHSTVVRFQNKLEQENNFLEALEKYKDFDFGEFDVNWVELVFNDWYQRKEHVRILSYFDI